jgi:hypothetical protein
MITVKHSGHIGDVVYSLAAVKAIAINKKDKIRYYLWEGVHIPTDYDNGLPKPALTRALCEFIKPLIEAQPYVETCLTQFFAPRIDSTINVDLDLFRRLPINFYLGHLPLHYMHLIGEFYDYALPWITVNSSDTTPDYKNTIVIGRSVRNINPMIDYSVLNRVKNDIIFLGTNDEFVNIKQFIKGITHAKLSDAYHGACILASCRLFIGNSSFHFAVAEALKTVRCFEMNLQAQSLMPCNGVTYFTTTEQLVAGLEKFGLI